MFSALSDLCFKSCSVPSLESHLLLQVAKSMFISSVNRSTFWRPRQRALLLRVYGETSPPFPPRHTRTHTPLPIARVYVPGRPVNFLSRIHRYADISGIDLLLRTVLPPDSYLRWLYCVCLGVGSHRKCPSVSLWTAQTRGGGGAGRTSGTSGGPKLCRWGGNRAVVNKKRSSLE